MSTSSAPSPAVVGRRPPAPVIAATVITVVLLGVGMFGLVFFGVVVGPDVNPDAGTPSAVAFAAVGLLYCITGLASLPGLWRGSRPAWHLLTCVLAAWILFNAYKIFVEGEAESVVIAVADLVVMALLLLPATRRHVSA